MYQLTRRSSPGAAISWPSLTRPGPQAIPVVGPTEALRGRAGGPGVQAPPGAVPGLLGHGRQSGWQLASRVWQESGVNWEGDAYLDSSPDPDPYAANQYMNDWFSQPPAEPAPEDPSEQAQYEQPAPYEPEQSGEPEQSDEPEPSREPAAYEAPQEYEASGQYEAPEPYRDPEPYEAASPDQAGYPADDIRPAEQYLVEDIRPTAQPLTDPHPTSPDLAVDPREVARYAGGDLSAVAAELDDEQYPAGPYLAGPSGYDDYGADEYADEQDPVDPNPTRFDLPVFPAEAGPDGEPGARGAAVREPAAPQFPPAPKSFAAPPFPAAQFPAAQQFTPALRFPAAAPPLPRRIRRAGGPPPARPFEDAPPAAAAPAPQAAPAPARPAAPAPAPPARPAPTSPLAPAPASARTLKVPPSWSAPTGHAQPPAQGLPRRPLPPKSPQPPNSPLPPPPVYSAPRSFGPSPSFTQPHFTQPLSAPVATAPPLNGTFRPRDIYGASDTYRPDDTYAPNDAYAPDDRYGPDDSYGPDDRYGPDDSYGPDDRYGPDDSYGPDDAQPNGSNGSDELFRAWQGSVRQAAAPRPWPARRPPAPLVRRRRGSQAVKIGVPAAVIITVGAGALLMLTGRANEMLADRATNSPAAPASAAATSLTLAGYPDEQGTVGVTALWTVGAATVAVGYADNHPAVWRRASDGSWSLVSAAVLGSLPGHFTSVSEGPLGWIAVGSAREDGLVEPVVYASADGVTWTPLPGLTSLAGTDAEFLGVTASAGGYLVVGQVGTGSAAYADFWWSSDLRDWTSGGNSANHGSIATAAVATTDGFVAVGSENGCHTIWTSADGKAWQAHDLAKPGGVTTAILRYVTAGPAGTVVGAGFATTSTGDIPLVVTSTDGGAHVSQVVLDSGGSTTITGITATADGYVAVGTTGAGAARHAVSWTSADGLTWSAATTVTNAGTGQITALTSAGTAATQHGDSSTVLTIPAP